MHAEIIAIGEELTSGQRLDTNSQWISQRLGELGVPVAYHTTVGDEMAACVHAYRAAIERADVVISTGGLGPTADDLTREAIATVAGVDLVLDEPSLSHIEGLFSRRKRKMPEANRVQAMFPRGTKVIFNPAGTAPGIELDVNRTSGSKVRLFALPGVPAELREMWEQTVAPAISKIVGAPRVIRHKQIKCFGVGESDLEQMLPDLIRRGRDPQVGITVHGATITLRITAMADTPEACYAAMQPTIDTIREYLGTLVFGEDDEELEHAVVRLLIAQNKKLATAEWGSGGMLADWLSNVPQSAGHFLGGIVVRNREALLPTLGLDASGDQAQIVSAMAQACRERLNAEYGVAVGELPLVEPQSKEPPLLYFAVAGPDGVTVKNSPYVGHPDILKARGGKQALDLLRLTLLR